MTEPQQMTLTTDGTADELAAAEWLALPRYRLGLIREPVPPYTEPTTTPAALAAYLGRELDREPAELMGAVYLDQRNSPVAVAVLYRGTLSRAAVEPRAVLAVALLINAAGFALYHNHPSGDPSPSAEDLALTRRMAEAGELLGIRLVDHLILGHGGRFVSLRERGAW